MEQSDQIPPKGFFNPAIPTKIFSQFPNPVIPKASPANPETTHILFSFYYLDEEGFSVGAYYFPTSSGLKVFAHLK